MKHIHLIGIGGAGLSAIATVLLESGHVVSGSDAHASPVTDQLAARGAKIAIGHRAENVARADTVIVSSAIPADNPELLAAKAQGIPVMKRSEFLGHLMSGRTGVAVAGTHGKTTTTALIAYLLLRADRDPSFIVGGVLSDLGVNARHGQGAPFVVEADEYDGMFLGLRPDVAVVTNVEHDHPDNYPTREAYAQAFEKFVALISDGGTLIACCDDPGAKAIGDIAAQNGTRLIWYGLKNGSQWKAEDVQSNGAGGNDFVVTHDGKTVGLARNRLPGLQNVANSLAALAAADAVGVDFNTARNALTEFRGVGRRFEVKGEAKGITIVDDYAHHPTEIRATLAAARRRYAGRKIWAMFQPHTFSRTRALLADFAASFADADHVLVTDIFRSREAFDPAVNANDIVRQMTHPDARYLPTLAETTEALLAEMKAGDVLITLGAGDVNKVGEDVLKRMMNNEAMKNEQ